MYIDVFIRNGEEKHDDFGRLFVHIIQHGVEDENEDDDNHGRDQKQNQEEDRFVRCLRNEIGGVERVCRTKVGLVII